MKAIFFEAHGGFETLKYADLPDPQPKPGEALVRVRAVALNHLDIWVRRGWKGLRLEMPHIGGSDIAGEVVECNCSSKLEKGTRVVINPGVLGEEDEFTRRGEDSLSRSYQILGETRPGGMAEYITVPVQNLYRLPDSIPFEQGAAAPLVATTCWRMLFHRAQLQPGETVLVVGAGGGVNSLATQLSLASGANVICLTSSNIKAEKCREMGVKEVINYTETPDWSLEVRKRTQGRGVDLVIDNVGQATFDNSLRSLRRGGRLVTVGNTSGYDVQIDNRLVFSRQISILGSTMGSRQDFIDAMNFLWEKRITPVIDTVAPLERGIEMLQRLEEGKQFGKIVLTCD